MKLDWRDSLEVGDVIVTKAGGPRIVRAVRYKDDGLLRSVSLVIRHCSWTGRCYTVVNRSDLAWRGFTLAGVRVPLDRLIDRMIRDQLMHTEPTMILVRCCEVKEVL